MPSTYAGCGCTALTPAYGRPTFVPSNPRGYGESGQKSERTTGEKALIILGGLAAIYTIHRLAGGFTPPPAYKTPRRAVTSEYYVPEPR